LRPHVGDTIRLRMDQDVEVVATSRMRGRDSTYRMQRHLTVHSRSIIERADAAGAVVLAVTDSAVVRDGSAPPRRTMAGGSIQFHVAPDGATRVMDGGGMLTPEASALVAQMPATLPKGELEIGDSWRHAVQVPIPGLPTGAPTGTLIATFRLDSLSRYGDVAYVSMRGSLARPAGGVALPQGGRYESTGTVIGQLEVDRRRGWLTGMRATVSVRSVLTPPPGVDAAPMHVSTLVKQWLRSVDAVDKR
ncbi:MAG TPA: hypothetical protein VFX39_00785, partial [Gemmatimonadaceae bacterium]|nr:hypothetical protein [Gemmatimonadaceae bacterium]